MPASSDIRQQYIDYFRDKHKHTFVPSSPVVPHDDPTLLFTNAGMNQFKDAFLGTGTSGGRDYTRAVNTQKCIRAGGKHNDLEDVGKDTYHHTFFEMLGNWSFGDYFKREAIAWAWDLLTNVWGLDKSRLHATVFAGDEREDLDRDEEAAALWKSETDIDHANIHLGDKKDNFWEMGDTGPCGPCSEIHIDLTPDKTGGPLVNKDDPRVIEIWNLVFIQYNRNAAGLLTPLPQKHVDTGMGFERLCAVLQGKSSNYDTDVFTPIFKAISDVTGAPAYGSKMDDPVDMAHRVIADHIRCLTFALTDGALPSNEGRGYVLRRILRRAFRHGRQTLDQREPFLYKLVPAVVDTMREAFPELAKNPQHVADVIKDEEQSFARTIDRGIALFEDAAQRGGDRIRADDAFMLYDTYGFPLDLTQVMAEERGLAVDVKGFNKLMEEARTRSRAGSAGGTDARQSLIEIVQQQKLPATIFTGYDRTRDTVTTACRVFGHQNANGYETLDQLTSGMHGAVVIESTPFYAESGGQVGDTGLITIDDTDVRFRVEDTVRVGDAIFHLGEMEEGTLKAGDKLTLHLVVNEDRRRKIMGNHTGTHLMNLALRKHVSSTADQRGSLVDDEKTRFDYAHNAALTDDQADAVEQHVREQIKAELTVHTDYAPQEEAMKINGLRAVFGEKYPPKVRVVSVGPAVGDLLAQPDNADWPKYSIEFCGGTHLRNSAELGDFALISEEAVAKGVRRVTAVTGQAAADARREGERLQRELEAMRDTSDDASQHRDRNDISEIMQEINGATLPLALRRRLTADLAEVQQKLKELDKQRAQAQSQTIADDARKVADEADDSVIVAKFDGADGTALRTAMDVIRKKRPNAALLLAGIENGKVALVAAVPEPCIKQGLKAGDWVREVAKVVGGGGGGRPDMAQAGGKDPSKIEAALDTARQFAASKM
ncbi:alanine--tRNA ligase [Phycisphaerales bacterium AB-hyl4]|uniref:Alanine--tRNA ligase n=1 Tax=Natronomicrosphaera hydrolytica TaxID=3242702 RepID=A0ABV4U2C7_9BACT